QKIGAFVLELLLGAVGGIGTVEGTLARILYGQRRSDDQDFAQAFFAARGEHHARDARIDRKLRKLPADRSEIVVLVDCAQLGQQLVTVRDHSRAGRIEKRKILDVADA